MNQITKLASSLGHFQDFAAGLRMQGVILIDHEQSIMWANPAALQLHGVEKPEQLGATVSEYFATFSLGYAELSSSVICGAVRHAGLCEGVIHLLPAGKEAASVPCRMQLFEIVDPNGITCSTAVILQIDGRLEEAASTPVEQPEGLSQVNSSAPLRLMAHSSNVIRSAFAQNCNPGWDAPSATDVAAMQHREMAARARAMCAVVPIPLHVLDSGMRILCVTDAWLNWLGYKAQSVIGRDIGLFMDAETRIRFEQQAWARLQEVGFTDNVRCRFLKRSGETVDAIVAASATVDEAGELAYTTCIPVEIESHQHDDGLMRVMKMSPAPTLCWQLDTLSVREANQAFYTLMGHPAGSLAGQNLDDLGLWETKATRHRVEQELGQSGAMHRQDLRLRTSTGEMLTCAGSASLVRLSGHACGVLMLQDVTDRRRDEAQLFEAIEAVMKDSTWFSRQVIERLATLRSPPRTYGRHAQIAELTRRESEVLTLISVGQCDLEIARQLGLTRSTVRNHVATLYSKIDVHSRSAATVWARERGINLTMNRTPKENGRGVPL